METPVAGSTHPKYWWDKSAGRFCTGRGPVLATASIPMCERQRPDMP